MILKTIAILSVIHVALCGLISPSDELVLHEQREEIPAGFSMTGPAPPGQVVKLRLALVQGDMATLEQKLYDVSTPSSNIYGQHLSKEEVEAFVRPTAETTSIVTNWLKSNNLQFNQTSPAGDWLSVFMPVSQANTLFNTTLSVFTHEASGQKSIRTLAYSIPSSLQGHLEFVYPMISFSTPIAGPVVSSSFTNENLNLANLSSNASVIQCNGPMTPACLQHLYGIPTQLATQPTNQLGVSSFMKQFANQADLTFFLESLRPDLPSSTTFSLQTLDGGENPQNASETGVEANLDIQYTVGIASGVRTIFISVGNETQDGALDGHLDIVNSLLKESAPPQVLTISFVQNENTISSSLANQLCGAYMQLGTRGTTILLASGDGGVAGIESDPCTTFVPTFPSGCPFLTSVGATTINASNPNLNETAALFSSGGFSNVFLRPSYQNTSVTSYLAALGTTDEGKFNRTSRGYPDVSAQGENFAIVVDGESVTVSGTAASTSVFASVIALLNDRLNVTGMPPLGFLNPFLYSKGASALNDITSGDNPGCSVGGFPAKTGWDPVTGLGTPNYTKLFDALGLSSLTPPL